MFKFPYRDRVNRRYPNIPVRYDSLKRIVLDIRVIIGKIISKEEKSNRI